ncbi:MAG: phosphoribosyltransferase family protein, partial [Gaiellaceae bacterium]
AAQAKAEELDRRLHADRPALDPSGKTVVLVDDGLATGATMIAAARWAWAALARGVIVAVPVGATESAGLLASEVDKVVCLKKPAYFAAVGLWYEQFGPVSDERVLDLLERPSPAPSAAQPR